MIRLITPENDLPLFRMNSHIGATVLTARLLRGYLRALLIELGLSPKRYIFHSFRKGGASFCFNKGVELARIKAHGDWKSSAVWSYVTVNAEGSSKLAADIASIFKITDGRPL